MRTCFLLIPLLFASAPAHAASTPKASFTAINICVQKQDASPCRGLVTASSLPIYDRFASYNLVRCLPQNATYLSQSKSGSHVLIRASTMNGDSKRYMRLLFALENGTWKLDVPESLRLSMGENWEQQVNMTEQAYLILKTQMGIELNCDMINNLSAKHS